uniref:N-terminal acetyltransferase B complex subunit MDM20 homolog n=1 Tax=Steinernema glaseri TaxID=37863 RepID=A0A1I8AJ23_9BILA
MQQNDADQRVKDRRLKDLFEAIDAGQNKKAIQEADKLLKKHANFYNAIALKALAMIRLEGTAKALTIVTDLLEKQKNGIAMDDNTLDAICHCLKEASVPDRIVDMYANLVALNPNTEKYRAGLCLAYARIGDLNNQRKVLLDLSRMYKKPQYQYWNMTTWYMLALRNPNMRDMYLGLAIKTGERLTDSQNITSEGVDLYLDVLEEKEKYGTAVETMQNADIARHHIRPKPYISKKLCTLLIAHQEYTTANERLMNMLTNDPDEWSYWELLFDCAFTHYEVSKDKGVLDRLVDFVITKQFQDLSIEEKAIRPRMRAPMIARMELLRRLRAVDGYVPNGEIANTLQHFMNFINVFHKKPCCYIDIRKYLPLLDTEDCDNLVDHLNKKQSEINEKDQGPIIVLKERIKRALGMHENLTVAERRSIADELLSHLVDKCETEYIAGAGMAVLIVHLLWDIYLETEDPVALWEIVSLLEFSCERYPDATTKLLLMRMYGILGCMDNVVKLHDDLEIKYVQKDSMGYHLLPIYDQFGDFEHATKHFTALSAYFDQTDREVAECVVQAYKTGAVSKVLSLAALQRRCESSVNSLYGDVSNRLFSSCFTMDLDKLKIAVQLLEGDDLPIDWEGASDNRDLNVIDNLDPDETTEKISKLQTETFKEMVDVTKLRHLLCKYVAPVGLASQGLATPTPETVEQRRVELKNHLDYCVETYPENKEDKPRRELQAPTDVRIGPFAHSGVVQMTMKMMEGSADLIRIHSGIEKNNLSAEEADNLLKEALGLLPKPEDLAPFLDQLLPKEVNTEKPFFLHVLLPEFARAAIGITLGGRIIRFMESMIISIYERAAVLGAPSAKKGTKREKKVKIYVPVFESLRGPFCTARKQYLGLLSDISLMLNQQETAEKLIPAIPREHWAAPGSYDAIVSCHPEVKADVMTSYKFAVQNLMHSSLMM